jgi:hypothetical protein
MTVLIVEAPRSPRLMIGPRIEQVQFLDRLGSEQISTWRVQCKIKHLRWVQVHMADLGIVIREQQKAG